ncbi:MAG: nickel-binding protein [Candidatus Limnocylindrales bacterium]
MGYRGPHDPRAQGSVVPRMPVRAAAVTVLFRRPCVGAEAVAFYLVERYVPSMTAAEVAAAAARLDEPGEGGVRHLLTVLVLGEDTCLSVFEAADVAAVQLANTRASFPLDRVVEVTPISAQS